MVNLYKRINDLCKSKNLSIPKMCEKAQIRSSIIYDLKSGKKENISRKTAEKISAALGITVSDLYNEKAPDTEAPRAEIAEALLLIESLSEDKQKQALDYLRFLANKG